VIIVAVIVSAAGLGACSSGHSARPVASSTSLPVTTTTEPAPQYAPSPYSWDRVTSPALAVGGGASATLAGAIPPELTGTWTVFGSRLDGTDTPSATVWSSPDALRWSSTALSASDLPSQARAAARYKTVTVVAGSTGEGVNQQAAVWLSSGDGVAFQSESVPESNGPSAIDLITAGSLGIFAAGTVDGRFAMWSSTNGRQWSELPDAERVIGISPGAQVHALLAEGDFVYAAGSMQSGSALQAALWASADGINWHLVGSAGPSFSGPGGRVIYSLAPLNTGLVAVGALAAGRGWVPASWISPDGQSWSLPSEDFPGAGGVSAVAGGGFGLSGGSAARSVSAVPTLAGPTSVVAAGGGPTAQYTWQSSDGLHWTALPLPAAAAQAGSWRAETAASTVDTTVVLDSEPGQPYLLTDSRPGGSASGSGTWAQPSSVPTVFGPVRAEVVPVNVQTVAGHIELSVDVVVRPQSIGSARVSNDVLTSTDGSNWALAPPGTALSGSPPTIPVPGALTTRLPTGWLAVASRSGAAPLVWSSPTGATWKPVGALSVAQPVAGGSSSANGSSSAGVVPSTWVNGMCAARLPSVSGEGAVALHYVAATVGSSAVTTPSPIAAGGTTTTSGQDLATSTPSAWVTNNGTTWRSATVNAGPPSGAIQSMSGCGQTGSALSAFGTGTAPAGAPEPALWRSIDGTTWSRVPVPAFTADAPNPLVALATDGDYWLAAANPDPTADLLDPAQSDGPGRAAPSGSDAGVGPTASVENGRDGLWLSTNGGAAWQLIDTATAPWVANEATQLDLVGFAPSGSANGSGTASIGTSTSTGASTTVTTNPGASAIPVVFGVVDGQLAVWTGTPASGGSGRSSS
jgi:hypothetical protein